MATESQIQAFINKWKGPAAAAAKSLNIPTAYVLAQWGMESNYGTQTPTGSPYNLAGIKCTNGNCAGPYQVFTNAESFVQAYTQSVHNDFARPSSNASGGLGGFGTVADYFGHYVPGHDYASIPASSYANRVQAVLNTFGSQGLSTASSASPSFTVPAQIAPVGSFSSVTGNSQLTPILSMFSKEGTVLEKFGMGVVGGILIIIGILFLGDWMPKKAVTKEVKKHA